MSTIARNLLDPVRDVWFFVGEGSPFGIQAPVGSLYSQVDGSAANILHLKSGGGENDWSAVTASGSSSVTWSAITGIPVGLVSSSAQAANWTVLNALQLGGVGSGSYARRDTVNTFSNVQTIARILANDNSAGTTAYSFVNDAGMGMYRIGARRLGLNAGAGFVTLELDNAADGSYRRGLFYGTQAENLPQLAHVNALQTGLWWNVTGGAFLRVMVANTRVATFNSGSVILGNIDPGDGQFFRVSGSARFTGTVTAPLFSGDLTGSVTNANRLGGIAASNYARTDTGNTFVGVNTFSPVIRVNGTTSQFRGLEFYTAGAIRWFLYQNAESEPGSNAGGSLRIARYSDGGSYLGDALNIERATGNSTFGGGITVPGGISTTSVSAGTSVIVGTDPTGPELLRVGGGIRATGISVLGPTNSEGLNIAGVRGLFSGTGASDGAGIHLYSNVLIGDPGGWFVNMTQAPSRGLGVWGAINIGYGNSAASVINGTLTVINGGQTLNIRESGATTHAYLAFQNSAGTRKGYFGFPANDVVNIQIVNEVSNGTIDFVTGGQQRGRFSNAGFLTENLRSINTGQIILDFDSTYTRIRDNNERVGIYIGSNADKNNYYDNDGHRLRSRDGTVTFANIQNASAVFNVGGVTHTLGTSGITSAEFIVSSDVRLKSNLQPLMNSLTKVNSLRGYHYEMNGRQEVGVIAQDVQAVLPEAVTTREDGYLGVAYDRLVPLLIESVKELHREIEMLRCQLKA